MITPSVFDRDIPTETEDNEIQFSTCLSPYHVGDKYCIIQDGHQFCAACEEINKRRNHEKNI